MSGLRFSSFLSRYWYWLLTGIAVFALAPRGVVTEEELNAGNRWSEYLVYRVAASRLESGEALLERPSSQAPPAIQHHLAFEPDAETSGRIRTHVYSYPPTAALLAWPLTMVDDQTSEALLWHLMLMVATVIGVWATWRLFHASFEPSATGAAADPRGWLRQFLPTSSARTFAVLVVIAVGWLMAPVTNQQTDSLIFAAAGLGFLALSTKRPLLAGVLLALAATIKGPMLVAGLWLLVARQWRAAAAMTLSGVGWWLLPSLIFPQASGELHIVTWVKEAALPALSGGNVESIGAWANSLNEQNQALRASLLRIAEMLKLDGTPKSLLKYLGLALSLGIVGLIVHSGHRRGQLESTADAANPAGVHLAAFALCGVASLLLSPMTSPSHLCLGFPAVVWVFPKLWRAGSGWRWQRLLILLLVVSITLIHKDLLGREVVTAYRMWGMPMLTLLVLCVLTWWLMRRALTSGGLSSGVAPPAQVRRAGGYGT